MTRAGAIAEAARALGFARCGFATVSRLPRERFFRHWLAEGRAGTMSYLGRRFHGRLDPRRLFPWVRSIVSVAYPYPPPPPPPARWHEELRGRVAAYAGGPDYHDVVGERLRHLAARIVSLEPAAEARVYVDTGPVLEREWGRRGGLGWFAKNTMLLDAELGSWFLLGEVLTSLDLPETPVHPDRCGTCTRCLDVCPTGALEAGLRMDPRRCISYLTIEHRGPIPRHLRPALENWIFGCDLCQEVCPWNDRETAPDARETFYPELGGVLALDATGFRARYGRTAVTRAGRRGLLRNTAVALGNSGNREAVPALLRALADPEPLVRGHAAWALGRLGGGPAAAGLEGTRRTDPDAWVREEAVAALEGR